MAYNRINIVKSSTGKSPGAAAPKEPNVTIVAVDDILVFPPRDGNNVAHVGNFVLNPNAKMIQVYMTPSKTKAGYTPEGSEDDITFKHMFEGEHPGNELQIGEFVQNWTGVNCIVIYGSCSDAFRKVVGTKCAPMQLKAELKDDNDSRVHMLKFDQAAKAPFVPGHYTGTLSLGAPIVPTTVTPLNVNHLEGLQYKLPVFNTAADITLFWASVPDGEIVTLIGSGGTAPAVLKNGVPVLVGVGNTAIILTKSLTWVALEGAVINLKAISGVSTNYFLEVSRS